MKLLRTVSAITVIGALGALAACTTDGGQAGDEEITLTVSTWTANEPGLTDWWPTIIETFEAEHENATVEVQQIAYANYIPQVTTGLTAGSSPDVIHVPIPPTTLPAWASAGFLEEMESVLEEAGILDTWPATQGDMTWEGVNYGPLLVEYGHVLYYNENLLNEAGVAVPTTAEEFVSAADAVAGLRDGIYGYAATNDSSPAAVSDLLRIVTSSGASIAEDGEWNLIDPSVVEAVDTWRELNATSPVGLNQSAAREAFLNEQSAMMVDGPFYYATVKDAGKDHLKLAATPFSTQSGQSSHGMVIPAGLDDAKRELAEAFVLHAVSEDSMEEYVKLVASPVARPGASELLLDQPMGDVIVGAAQDTVPLIDPSMTTVRERYSEFAELVGGAISVLVQPGSATEDVLAQLQSDLEAKGIKP